MGKDHRNVKIKLSSRAFRLFVDMKSSETGNISILFPLAYQSDSGDASGPYFCKD